MNERIVAEAVRDWALEEVPALKSGYAYPVASKLGELPDICCVVKEVRKVTSDPALPFSALAQFWLRVFDVEVSIMVGIDDTDDYEAAEAAHESAHQQLEQIGEALRERPAEDADLGGRLTGAGGLPAFVSPLVRTSYEPPFAELEDGTRGRFVFLYLTVGEAIAEPG